jgi:broad specificity phosphatase PhoE
LDAPLTEKGREQAREARTVLLPHMKPQVVLVSPLTRTLQTAEEIFQPRPGVVIISFYNLFCYSIWFLIILVIYLFI